MCKFQKPVEVELYSLDIKAIEMAYKHLLNSSFDFSLLGSSVLKKTKNHNCVGLITHLLKHGGINKLLYQYGINELRANIEMGIDTADGALIGSVLMGLGPLGAIDGAITGFIWGYLNREVSYLPVDVEASDIITPSSVKWVLDHAKKAGVKRNQQLSEGFQTSNKGHDSPYVDTDRRCRLV